MMWACGFIDFLLLVTQQRCGEGDSSDGPELKKSIMVVSSQQAGSRQKNEVAKCMVIGAEGSVH